MNAEHTNMPPQLEALTKAAQCSDLLEQDIREAHKLACKDSPYLGILLIELIGDAMKIKNRLAQLQSVAE